LAFRSRRAGAAIILAGSIAAYVVDVMISDHVGWWSQFYLNFVDRPLDLTSFRPAFSMQTYLSVVKARILDVLHLQWVYAAMGLTILAVTLLARHGEQRADLLLAAIVAGAAIRFLAYPSVEMRHYDPLLVGLCIVVLHASGRPQPHPVGG
jgi:hypothetical protein